MSSSLESQILLAIWTMYQRNQISMEQKGCIKDLLIRKDNNLYQSICNCKRQDQIEERLLDILNYLDAEDNIYPIFRLSNQSSSPTTTQSQCHYPEKRFRFKSSNNESDTSQNFHRIRSNSQHHK
ncbi:unnamed protein product [Paramecium pentaurelia]|uniref:Uncharacterized protein n=1 Tax=Paramecium pentaurelia TaxID=43138 RepID=A0A8S1UBD6_9CILI|nr:unnamed protein product [Paramecium pentaurelia]